MMLLVALALAASVLVAGQVLVARANGRLSAELAHEGNKLRAYAERAVDPRSGQPFSSVDTLLASFLRDNLPELNETFFSVVDGKADRRSSRPPPARLDTDPEMVGFAAKATRPVSRTVQSSAGPALVAVFPVRVAGDSKSAALVVVEFEAPVREEVFSVLRVLAVVSFGALTAAGLVSWLVAGRVLRPIRMVRRAADRISETDLTTRIGVTGDGDVAQLARTFNRMLDRLQSAFGTQRQFLDDAGHELRTPLTVIRGHLELMDEDPIEREQTIALVIDELDRMQRIVDELTVLAKVDRPDFLRVGHVDLADLTVEVAAKARAIAPRRWLIDSVAEHTITADGQRLTQALMQLVANAVANTAEGDVIAVGSAVVGVRARLWVRDTGRGVHPADREVIFERFGRGRGSGQVPGAGLGLAIVNRIARAHGGQVLLDSAPGAGAVFSLDLPLQALSPEVSPCRPS